MLKVKHHWGVRNFCYVFATNYFNCPLQFLRFEKKHFTHILGNFGRPTLPKNTLSPFILLVCGRIKYLSFPLEITTRHYQYL